MSADDVERNVDPAEAPPARDYLARLADAGRVLPPDRRAEMLADVQEHLRQAVTAEELAGSGPDVAVRRALDLLGTPEDIVRAEFEQSGLPDRPREVSGMQRFGDPIAVVLLLLGGFLVGIGWLVGVALLWISDSWRLREKVLGTLVWPFGYAGLLIVGGVGTYTESCTSTSSSVGAEQMVCTGGPPYPVWIGVLMAVVVLAAPIAMAVLLWRRRAAVLAERELV